MKRLLREDRDLFVGSAVAVVLTVLVVGGISGVFSSLVGGEEKRLVRATFANTQQLQVGNDVRVDGIDTGTIKSFEVDVESETTTATMELEDTVGSLYDDARAVVRLKTVLGGAFYVDIERGTPGREPLGDAPIPLERTAFQVELDDVTEVLKGGAREGLKILPGETAAALRDEDVPRELLDTVADISPGADKGLNALRGQDLDRDLQGVIENVSATVDALNTPRDDIRTVVEGAAATLRTTAGRADDIRTMLAAAPATEREVNLTLDRLEGTLDLADPLIGKLQEPATQVAPTFARLRPVLVDADGLLDRAVPLLRTLRPAATALARTARRGLPMVQELTPSINRLRDHNLPMLSEVDAGTQKSTAVMIGGTFAGLASGAGGQMDANGHFIRFPATSGSAPFNSLPCQTYFNNPDSSQAVVCQDLSQALESYLDYDPTGTDTPGTEPSGLPQPEGGK